MDVTATYLSTSSNASRTALANTAAPPASNSATNQTRTLKELNRRPEGQLRVSYIRNVFENVTRRVRESKKSIFACYPLPLLKCKYITTPQVRVCNVKYVLDCVNTRDGYSMKTAFSFVR
jgi:hypothetical protein